MLYSSDLKESKHILYSIPGETCKTLTADKVELQAPYLCWIGVTHCNNLEWHNILPPTYQQPYQLNNGPTFSLLRLHQPASTVVHISMDKAERESSSGPFSHGSHIHTTEDYFTETYNFNLAPADQLHQSIFAQLLAVNSGQKSARCQVLNGGHKKTQSSSYTSGEDMNYLHDNKTIWHPN